MAILEIDKRMAFWDVLISDVPEWNKVMNNVVSSIEITYELNKPTKANITIQSESYIEAIFTAGRKIEIKMGFSMTSLISMMTGFIMKNPTGSAQDKLVYNVEVISNGAVLTTIARNFSYINTPYMDKIIIMIAARNNLLHSISIKNKLPLKKDQIPIQMNETDYQFIQKCALKWGCVFWIDNPQSGPGTIYFYDRDKASAMGDLIKKYNMEDLQNYYNLGYRTDSVRNNVSKVEWKFKKKKKGDPAVGSLSESGDIEQPEDYTINYQGERWELKPGIVQAIKNDWKVGGMVAKAIFDIGVENVGVSVTKYFRQCAGNSKTNKDTYGNETIDLSVDLNIGDPYLRPPRTARLISGCADPTATNDYLPDFLYEGGASGTTLFDIIKVVTKLDAGKLNTQIHLSRNSVGLI